MDKREIVDTFLSKGILLSPEALNEASNLSSERLAELAEDLERRGIDLLTIEDLEGGAEERSADLVMRSVVASRGSDSRVDYLKHFQNRFQRLASIVRSKRGEEEALSLLEIKNTERVPAFAVGMVASIEEDSPDERGLLLEDGTGSLEVTVTEDSAAWGPSGKLVLDEVVGIAGQYHPDRQVLSAESIEFPDIGQQERPLADFESYAVFLSDLHYGCEDFMEDSFRNFIRWLKGEFGDPEMVRISGKIDFVIICGDLIENGERNALELYEGLVEILSEVPERIAVLCIPGEGDAAGVLEPQPGFIEEALGVLNRMPNFHQGSNPCEVDLNGVPVTLYHGRSIEQWSSALGVAEPCEVMKQMLIRRHLAPTYGTEVPVAPTRSDPFLIGDPPRILCTGHTHISCASEYKGVLLIGSPSWRSREAKSGAGSLYLVDLSTLKSRSISFAP